MNLHKGLLITVSISTALIFSVSGCGMFKSSQTTEPGKAPEVVEKKVDDQPAPVTGGQTKAMAQSTSEQQPNDGKKAAATKVSGKQGMAAGEIYVVKKGDSLWKIAKAAYDNPLKWKAIYKANKKKIKDPNRIYPNQKLTIPAVK